ncbi:unnamed protein product [Musa banksii]
MEGSPRRRSSASSSPEFEFLAISNSPVQLLTADELFADGVVLPLHLLSLRQPHPGRETGTGTEPEPEPEPEPDPDPSLPPPPPPPSPTDDITASISCSPTSGSKRWKDIFRVGEKKAVEAKERKGSSGGAAEPSISLWPFSRSRSAGNPAAGGGRPRATAYGRKVSSTPCSRSNSSGEYSAWPAPAAGGRRWAASPGRAGGVPVGRTSPVWQIRRPEHRDKITGGKTGSVGAGIRVLNLNVNTLVGFRRGEGSCRGDDKVCLTARARTAGHSGGSLFSLRALFSKKVY